MFDLSQNSLKTKTLIGLAVTLFVASTACSHQAVRPANNDSGIAAVESSPTPEPLASDLDAPKAAKKSTHHRRHASNKVAKAKHRKSRQLLAKSSLKKHKSPPKKDNGVAQASFSKPAQLNIQAPQLPAPPVSMGTVSNTSDVAGEPSFWERAVNHWPLGLIGLSLAGLGYWVFLARTGTGKRRGSKRRLILNS